jgi:hypothetical protein
LSPPLYVGGDNVAIETGIFAATPAVTKSLTAPVVLSPPV